MTLGGTPSLKTPFQPIFLMVGAFFIVYQFVKGYKLEVEFFTDRLAFALMQEEGEQSVWEIKRSRPSLKLRPESRFSNAVMTI